MLDTTKTIVVGDLVYETAESRLQKVREAPPPQPRTAPSARLPLPFTELIDREGELEQLRALPAGGWIDLTARPGFGKTAILRFLAGQPQPELYPDGVVYLGPDTVRGPADVIEALAAELVAGETAWAPDDPRLTTLLQRQRALLLLDELPLADEDLERLRASVSRCTVVVARSRTEGDVPGGLELTGLPTEAGVRLFELRLGRSTAGAERDAAVAICNAFAGHPLALVQTAGLARAGAPLADLAAELAGSPHDRLAELLHESLSEDEERVVAALAAFDGASLSAQRLAQLAEVDPIAPVLDSLELRGLLRRDEQPERVSGLAQLNERMQQIGDASGWAEKAVGLFTGLASGNLSADEALDDLGAVFQLLGWADHNQRWQEALQLVKVAETGLALARRFDAWGHALQHGLHAADQLGDTRSQAWLYERLGSRAALLGDRAAARTYLERAAGLYESTGQAAAAQLSRRNLAQLGRSWSMGAVRDYVVRMPAAAKILATALTVVAIGGSLAAGYARPARGHRGAAGPPGGQGPAGPRGPRGKSGTAAQQGATGPQGPQGLQGLRGAQGAPAVELWADVASGGTVESPTGAGAPTDNPNGEGTYTLTFAKTFSSCAWTAIPTDTRKNPPPTSGTVNGSDTVTVDFRFPTDFVVTVLC